MPDAKISELTELTTVADGDLLAIVDLTDSTTKKITKSNLVGVAVSVTTKGDLQTFSTTPDRLPVGTNGQILESRSTETTGLKWIDPPNSTDLVNPTTDLTGTGITSSDLVANENQAFGDVCFINSTGQAQLGDADAIATASCVVMALETITTDNAGLYLKLGLARNDSWNWTIGGLIYLSTTGTSGNTLTQTAPSGTDDVIQLLGVAKTADIVYFKPELVQLEHV